MNYFISKNTAISCMETYKIYIRATVVIAGAVIVKPMCKRCTLAFLFGFGYI